MKRKEGCFSALKFAIVAKVHKLFQRSSNICHANTDLQAFRVSAENANSNLNSKTTFLQLILTWSKGEISLTIESVIINVLKQI